MHFDVYFILFYFILKNGAHTPQIHIYWIVIHIWYSTKFALVLSSRMESARSVEHIETHTHKFGSIKSDEVHTVCNIVALPLLYGCWTEETIEFDEIFRIKFNWSQPNRDRAMSPVDRLARRESQCCSVPVCACAFFYLFLFSFLIIIWYDFKCSNNTPIRWVIAVEILHAGMHENGYRLHNIHSIEATERKKWKKYKNNPTNSIAKPTPFQGERGENVSNVYCVHIFLHFTAQSPTFNRRDVFFHVLFFKW